MLDKWGKLSSRGTFLQRDIIKTTIYVDCKKGRGTLNSLEKFAIKISKNNYGYNAKQKLLNIHFILYHF